MSKNYIVGFPRIGEQRELKKVLEDFWAKKSPFEKVQEVAKELREKAWLYQRDAGVDFISSNDFSLYDNMLDTIVMLGAIPKRFAHLGGYDAYFAMARGANGTLALTMRKWFNTNYHYLVPELSKSDNYKLNATKIINEYNEAKSLGIKTKINIIGPLTFLALSKRADGGDVFELYSKVLAIYIELFELIAKLDDEVVVQVDEPIFVKDLAANVLSLIKPTYDKLCGISSNIKIALLSYFEHSNEATKILLNTPIWALGLDFVYGDQNIDSLKLIAKSDKVLICGVIDGRNIWINDMQKSLVLLEQISKSIPKDRLVVGSSCSLLHVPYTLKYEDELEPNIKELLSFALEKLDELSLLSGAFFNGADISQNIAKIAKRGDFDNKKVQDRLKNTTKLSREGKAEDRLKLQRELLGYSELVTTTIGSFPQTKELRAIRADFKNNRVHKDEYEKFIKSYIDESIAIQEECGLDILVHGEPERGDMVEYFGELLSGFAFSKNGWVQSYGTRCVKPPLIYGDVSREKPMTLEWITYAQSKTKKIVKGMLSGPVTILNWSFVRDDKSREEICKQIALCINDEVDDLQNVGIKIIQVDEAAFKEGYPLREAKAKEYARWAVESFKLSVSSAKEQTQIHTHMCYSDFSDIIGAIDEMDADVISIETARGGNELIKIFKKVGYKKEIGLGVYDIHSPSIPSVDNLLAQIKLLLEVLPKNQLWINPDCGLKTRKWEEVTPSLKNLVEATKIARERL
ncbi:MAG: 5-methyltetrahydropteroyltriglutamate--homocysteine S-methyltransferase [Sulfurimonadaceae bacterium]|jgi:5-methyltetrahydropteroyltriglutamate--homocysteine methyltransferase|nr:5-methyltetrahydropteroyltriglutamate--homocysteine S-methyltransferase [Sulfurimonadaceae bacterium]